jgi:hypothetical protein
VPSFSTDAIAWSAQATVGHITVISPRLTGQLERGLVDCQLTPAGKFRNGAARWWCVSHQTYWGVKADLARGDGCCRAADIPLQIVRAPLTIDPARAGPLSFSLSASGITVEQHGAANVLVPALAIEVAGHAVFGHPDIVQLNLTPPALAAMAQADGCVDCARCGYPHLDLGDFAGRPHRRHSCGHCGHDATHSGAAIISNPLLALAAVFPQLRFRAAPARTTLPQPVGCDDIDLLPMKD